MATNYTKSDYNLFFFLVQIDPTTALLNRPPEVSEETWNRCLYTTIVLGADTRAVLRTFPGVVSQMARIPWESPAVQQAFIEEKINSQKKIFLQKNG